MRYSSQDSDVEHVHAELGKIATFIRNATHLQTLCLKTRVAEDPKVHKAAE